MNTDVREKLIRAAIEAASHAYAPYSEYRVGAAVLCGDDRIYQGCNVENASYGLTICAERVALFRAYAEGMRQFVAVAVYAPQSPDPIPCGACRQVMREGGNNPLIIVINKNHEICDFTLEELLPHSFLL